MRKIASFFHHKTKDFKNWPIEESAEGDQISGIRKTCFGPKVKRVSFLLLILLFLGIISLNFKYIKSVLAVINIPADGAGVLYGAWIGSGVNQAADPTAFETATGKQLKIWHWFWSQTGGSYALNGDATTFNNLIATNPIATNATLMLSWSPATSSATLSDVNNGLQDGYIDAWANVLKNYNKEMFLRVMYDDNKTVSWWSSGTSSSSIDATKVAYKSAFQRIHDRFATIGATNVRFVWCPWASGVAGAGQALPSYPGNSYVDWICLDGFPYQSGKTGFASTFDPDYTTFSSNTYNKPLMIGTIASNHSFDATRATQTTNILTDIRSGSYPKIKALIWFNENSGSPSWDFTNGSFNSTKNAYTTAIANAYFFGRDSSDPNPDPSATATPTASATPTATPTPTPTPSPTPTPTPGSASASIVSTAGPATGAYWGAWVGSGVSIPGDETAFAAAVTKKRALRHWYWTVSPLNGIASNFASWSATMPSGMVLMLSWAPSPVDTTLATINSGTQDAYIDSWATALKSYGKEMFLRVMWEDNGNFFWWNSGNDFAAATKTAYKSAYQRIVNRFRAVGASNVKFIWCPNVRGHGAGDPTLSYPGNSYVDWIGFDLYPYTGGRSGNIGTEFNTDYTTFTAPAYGNKPLLFCEFGDTTFSDATRASHMTDIFTNQLPVNFTKVKMISWSSEPNVGDIMQSGYTQTLSALNTALSSSYYTGGDNPATTVVINKFSSASTNEWVELHNTDSSNSVDLTSWQIKETGSNHTISLSGTIPGGGLKSFAFSTADSLADSGDTIQLLNASSVVVDTITYGAGQIVSAPSSSQIAHRVIDGSGDWAVDSTTNRGWFQSVNKPSVGDVTTTLSSNSIDSNFSTLADYTNATNLYFQKSGQGKIQFSNSLNLANPTIATWLNTLPQKISLDTLGQVGLDTTDISGLINTQATVTMNNLTLSSPKVLVDGQPDTQNVVSNQSYDSSTGTLTFTATHFTTFTAVEGSSNNTSSSSSSSSNSNSPGCTTTPPTGKLPWLYAASSDTADSVKLFFADDGNSVTRHIINYGLKPSTYLYGAEDLVGNGQHIFLIQNLAPDTTYYFKIWNANGCAVGGSSEEISATTKSIFTRSTLQTSVKVITPQFNSPAPSTPPSFDPSASDNTSQPTQIANTLLKIQINNNNNQAVKGAKVTLHSTPQEQVSDALGWVQFKNVDPGQHQLLIAYNAFQGTQTINVPVGQQEIDLVVNVKENIIYASPIVLGIIVSLSIIIIILLIVLIRKNKMSKVEKRAVV